MSGSRTCLRITRLIKLICAARVFQPGTLNRLTLIVNTYIIIKKYSVYPIELFCFLAMDEYVRGAARYRPLNLSFWVVRSEPPFVFYR